jgi:hypothetical protein
VPGVAAGAPGAAPVAGEGQGGSSKARLLVGIGVAAAGVATAVVGGVTWHRAGQETDCVDGICREVYGGKGLGIAMTIGGAILAGAGAYLMLTTGSHTQVAVGPGGVTVAGRF